MSILDSVKFAAVEPPEVHDGSMPYVTHEGVLEVAGHSLRCYRLSDGKAIINADDFHAFFGALGIDPASSIFTQASGGEAA